MSVPTSSDRVTSLTDGSSRWWWSLGGATLAGLAIRLLYVLTTQRGAPLFGDAETYHLLGQVVSAGDGYVRPRELMAFGEVVPTAEFPPLWPSLLAVLDLLGVDSPTGQRLVGALIASSAIVVVGLLGREIGGPAVGGVAAWTTAVYPHFVVFGGSLLAEGVTVALTGLVVLAVVRSRSAPDERQAVRWWLVVSVAIAAAIMTRSEMLLLFVLLVLPAAWSAGDRDHRLRRIAIVGACTVVVVGGWTVRNLVALDGFVALTNNSGTALAGSNCDPVFRGPEIGGWRLDCVPEGDYLGLGEIEVARINRDAGIAYIGDHVTELPTVIAARLGRTFGVWDVERTIQFGSLEDVDQDWLWAAWYAWLLIVPAAGFGAVLLRRDGGDLWPLVAPLVVVVVVSVTTYGNQRFRVAAEPALVVLASYGIVAGWRHWVGRRGDPPDQAQAPTGSL